MNAWVQADAEKHLDSLGYHVHDYKERHVMLPKTAINQDDFQTQYMVVFHDEPHVVYYYGKNKKRGESSSSVRRMNSGDMSVGTKRHSEKQCVFSLQNRD